MTRAYSAERATFLSAPAARWRARLCAAALSHWRNSLRLLRMAAKLLRRRGRWCGALLGDVRVRDRLRACWRSGISPCAIVGLPFYGTTEIERDAWAVRKKGDVWRGAAISA